MIGGVFMYLNVKGVKKFYGQGEGRIMVLKGIECIIEKGEICVLLGPSGSGKSTLLNLIGGIEDIDEGSIFAVSYTHLDVYKRQVYYRYIITQRLLKENIYRKENHTSYYIYSLFFSIFLLFL